MNSKIISLYILLSCFAIYDKAVKIIAVWNTNIVVFFYVSFYSFILFVMYKWYNEARLSIDRTIIIILSLPFILRIVLNLLSIGRSRAQYNSLVSNEIIDISTWGFLAVILTVILWKKYIQ